MWDVRGWKRLTAHDDPPLPAARQEFLSWLAEVPESWQSKWRGRLKSDLDHPHYSVRLELYLHHYFRSNDWDIEIEPERPGSPNKPDFRVTHGKDRILVEAKAVLDEQSTAQQTQRLRQLADNLTSKLSRVVIIEPLSDLPPSLPARRIRGQIERRARTQGNEILEFDLSDEHLDTSYALKVVILPRSSDSAEPRGVGGTISGVHTITIAKQIRDALEQKAGKYGLVDTPFIIALYVETMFPAHTKHEVDALFGDRECLVPTRGVGEVTERRKPNGFFTSVRQGKRRHVNVSAVLFYCFKWLENTHVHLAHIYHNPFALIPLNPDLFPGVPQMVPCVNLKWINGEPE
jgi:hypothetical protein